MRRSSFVVALLLALPAGVLAQTEESLDEPEAVPAGLSAADAASLGAERKALEDDLSAITDVAGSATGCEAVREDDRANLARCTAIGEKVSSMSTAYRGRLATYRQHLGAASGRALMPALPATPVTGVPIHGTTPRLLREPEKGGPITPPRPDPQTEYRLAGERLAKIPPAIEVVRGELKKIQAKDLPDYAASFTEWEELDAEHRQELAEKAEELVVTTMLEHVQHTETKHAEEAQADLKKVLKAYADGPMGTEEWQRVARLHGLPLLTEMKACTSVAEFAHRLDQAVEVASTLHEHEVLDKVLRGALYAGLETRAGKPYKVFAADADFAVTAILANRAASVANDRVDALLAEGDAKLDQIRRLSTKMHSLVEERKTLEKRRAELIASGEVKP